MDSSKGEKKPNSIIRKYAVILFFWLVIIALVLIEWIL